MIAENLKQIKKLIEIQSEGRLGELLERLSYARRELGDYDPRTYVHAQLDAENIGRVAAKLLDIDADEATEVALEIIAPSLERQLGIVLIDEVLAEIEPAAMPVVLPIATTPAPARAMTW